MTIEATRLPAPADPAGLAAATDDQRWIDWQAKCLADDRAVRRKMIMAAPLVLMVAAVIVYLLIGG